MKNQYSSLQGQSPIADAQQSVVKVHRAVKQAQSHPSEETIENAKNAAYKAENALQQAISYSEGSIYQEPLERVNEDLYEDLVDLQEVENNLK